MTSFILNIPYTIIGLLLSLISFPASLNIKKDQLVFIVKVKRFWWALGYIKHARAMAFGNVILLGQNLEENDLEHELVHAEQYKREPLIHPILYMIELFLKGYRNNKYEIEAYDRAGNMYKE